MGRLTTHVLDTARGVPAAGVRIDLEGQGAAAARRQAVTNANGRTDAPLLDGAELAAGTWKLVFHVGEYFRARGEQDAGRFRAHPVHRATHRPRSQSRPGQRHA